MDDANRAMGPLPPTVSTNKKKQAEVPQERRRPRHGAGGTCVRQPELISRAPAAGVVSLSRINVPHRQRIERAAASRIAVCPRRRRGRRPRRDLSRAHPRRRLRRLDDRQLDGLAENRHRRCRPLRAGDRSRAPADCRPRSATASRLRPRPTTTAARSTGDATWSSRGVTPAARFWTLTLYNPDGELVANSINRYGFTSQEIVRHADGSFEIVVAPRANPGNWLPTGGVERYTPRAAPLRHGGRRFDQSRPRSSDAGRQDQELPMIRWLLLLFGGALLGGIVHLATIIILPRTATQDAYSRLARDRAGQYRDRAAGADAGIRADAVHGSGFRQRRLPLRSFAGTVETQRPGRASPTPRSRSIRATTSPITPSTTAPPAGA